MIPHKANIYICLVWLKSFLIKGRKKMSRRSRQQMDPKAQAYLSLVLGAIVVIIGIVMAIFFVSSEAKKPDDVEYFKGKVTKVISENVDYQTKKKSNGKRKKVKVYDCEVMIEYQVNDQTYSYQFFDNDRKSPIRVGATFYLEISPSDPNHIYSVNSTSNKFTNNIVKYIAVIILGGVGIAFTISGVKGIKKLRANENRNLSYSSSSYSRPDYQVSDYNSSEFSEDYYGTGNGNSSYNGTSLRG